MYYVESTQLRDLLSNSNQAVVALDSNIDLDAWASALALANLLEKFDTDYRLVCSNPIPDSFRAVSPPAKLLVTSSFQEILTELPKLDCIVIPDLGSMAQLGQLYSNNKDSFKNYLVIHVDHHLPSNFPANFRIEDTTAAATCEQMGLIYKDLALPIGERLATLLYAGLISDTRSFITPSVKSRTLDVASFLVTEGADVVSASRLALSQTVSQLKLWGQVLSKLESLYDGRVTVATVTKEIMDDYGSGPVDTASLVNLIDNVTGSQIAILFRVQPNGDIRTSFRSPKVYPVAKIAEKLGGGGHQYAAACTISSSNLADVKALVFKELQEFLKTEKPFKS